MQPTESIGILPQGIMTIYQLWPNLNIYMPSLRFCRCYSHFCSQFFIGEPWKKPVRKDGKLYLYSSSKFGLSQGSAESSTFFARATKNGWLKKIISRWNFLQLVIIEYILCTYLYLYVRIWCQMLIKIDSVSLNARRIIRAFILSSVKDHMSLSW